VAAQDPPDAVGRHPKAAPLGASEFGGDALRPEAGVAQGKGKDALLDEHRPRVGHLRAAALAGRTSAR